MASKLILITLILAAMDVISTQYTPTPILGKRAGNEVAYKQENRRLKAYKREFLRAFLQDYVNVFRRGSCIPLGSTGCEANNGKCCREGNPYTGTMRKCVNVGSFSGPVYKCVEA